MPRNHKEWVRRPAMPETHYIDNRIYSDPSIFVAEKREIFGKVWLFACHESELENSFDYRSMVVGGVPIVVVRGEDGRVRSFFNTCSHRGAQLVSTPRGNARNFTCIFHLWSYDTKGKCVNVSREDGYSRVRHTREDFGLREIRTEMKCGFVFVNFDDGADSLASYLGDALESVEGIFSSEPLEVFHYHEFELKANWKNWQETNSELYHEFLHVVNRRTSMRQPGYYDRTWKCFPNGHAIVDGPPLLVDYGKQPGWQADREGGPMPGLQPNEFRLVDVWPVTALIIRDSAIRIDTMVPLSPTRTLVQFRGLGLKRDTAEQRRGRARSHNQIWGPFGRNLPEDILATEAQSENIEARAARFSIVAREEERRSQDDISMRHFHEEWARRMGTAAGIGTGTGTGTGTEA